MKVLNTISIVLLAVAAMIICVPLACVVNLILTLLMGLSNFMIGLNNGLVKINVNLLKKIKGDRRER